jgi:hypothetical protein
VTKPGSSLPRPRDSARLPRESEAAGDEENKSGISSSVDYLTSNLGTATASGISLLFLLGDCCHNKFIVA